MLNTPASKYAKKYMCKLIIAFLFCRFLPGACFSYTVSLRVGFENLCMDIIYIYYKCICIFSKPHCHFLHVKWRFLVQVKLHCLEAWSGVRKEVQMEESYLVHIGFGLQ